MAVPTFGMVVTVPAPLINTARGKVTHEKAVKGAIEEALYDYWRGDWRKHFTAPGRGLYQYAERSAAYKKIKKTETRSITDCVRTGRTKTWMTATRPKFTIARGKIEGVARSKSGVGITGRLTMKFPFPVTSNDTARRKDGRKKISPTDLARELSTWTDAEMWKAARIYSEGYEKRFNELLKAAPRVKKGKPATP